MNHSPFHVFHVVSHETEHGGSVFIQVLVVEAVTVDYRRAYAYQLYFYIRTHFPHSRRSRLHYLLHTLHTFYYTPAAPVCRPFTAPCY